jgi:ssDNA-specific exonuclease RecJ
MINWTKLLTYQNQQADLECQLEQLNTTGNQSPKELNKMADIGFELSELDLKILSVITPKNNRK